VCLLAGVCLQVFVCRRAFRRLKMAGTMLSSAGGFPNTSFDYPITADRVFADMVRRIKGQNMPMVYACRLGENLIAPVRHFFLEDIDTFAKHLEQYIMSARPALDMGNLTNRANAILGAVARSARLIGRLVDKPPSIRSTDVIHTTTTGELGGSGTFSISLMLNGSTTHIFPERHDIGATEITAGDLKACSIACLNPLWADIQARIHRLPATKMPVGFKRKIVENTVARDMRAYDLVTGRNTPTPLSVLMLMGFKVFDAVAGAVPGAANATARVEVKLDARVVVGDHVSAHERMLAFVTHNRIRCPVTANAHSGRFIASDSPREPFAQYVALPFVTTAARAAKDSSSVIVQAYSSVGPNPIVSPLLGLQFVIDGSLMQVFNSLRADVTVMRVNGEQIPAYVADIHADCDRIELGRAANTQAFLDYLEGRMVAA
jgi:hypothetical protein